MMATTSQIPKEILDAAIWLFNPNIPFIVMSFISCFMIIVLNAVEIHFIRKKWRRITRFEIILVNLAGADMLTGLTILAMTIAESIYFAGKSYTMEFFVSMTFFIMLSISSAGNFVVVIGIERLSAVRRPLQHRITNYKRSQMLKWMVVLWLLNLSFATLGVCLDHHFNKQVIKGSIGSKKLGIALGAYLLVGVVLIVVIYLQIAICVLTRIPVEVPDRSEAAVVRRCAQKEKAAVVACALVVIAYLVFNVPIAANMLQGKVQQAEFILMTLNSVANPLIYFFKAYVERNWRRKINDGLQGS